MPEIGGRRWQKPLNATTRTSSGFFQSFVVVLIVFTSVLFLTHQKQSLHAGLVIRYSIAGYLPDSIRAVLGFPLCQRRTHALCGICRLSPHTDCTNNQSSCYENSGSSADISRHRLWIFRLSFIDLFERGFLFDLLQRFF